MKAIVNPQALGRVLKKAAPVIRKNTVLPILTSVLLEFEKNKVTVKATNLETLIVSSIECDCKVPFTILIEHSNLSEICSKIKSPLLFDISGDKMLLKSDEGTFKFAKSVDENLFPKAEAADFLFDFEVDSDFFWSLSSANSFRCTDDNRVNMNAPCVHIKKDSITLVGTDALVLYKNTLKIKTGNQSMMMIPEQFILITKGFSEGKISVSDKFIKVETTDTTIISKLFDAKYCNYEFIIPEEINYNFKANREELIRLLDISDITANAGNHMIALKFNKDGLNITSQNIDYGMEGESSTLKASHTVDIEAIGVNGGQMLKLLNVFDSEDVEMAFATPTKTIFIRPAGDPNLLTLLQPLMLI